MRKFGLIGYPLGHSFSKKYFTEKFETEHISDSSYDNYPLTDLNQFIDLINNDSELCGLNVTIPYKTEIIKHLDWISVEANDIGAVNVIKIKRANGRLKLSGYNSDVAGIRDSLLPFVNVNIKHALVLGTGGSSRAVCYVLKQFGIDITLVSRVRKSAVITYSDITPDIIKQTGLIINTTPLGMFPDIDKMPGINYSLLSGNHVLFDLVYNPELTAFLKKGMEQGSKVISGLKMLYSQAEKAWEIWNDDNM